MTFSIPDEYKGINGTLVDIDVAESFCLSTTWADFLIIVEASDIEQSDTHLKLTLLYRPNCRELLALPFVDNNQDSFIEAYKFLSTQINYFAKQKIEHIPVPNTI